MKVVILSLLLIVNCPSSLGEGKRCNTATTCGECIRIPECLWCSIKDSFNFGRCNTREGHNSTGCAQQFLVDPKLNFTVVKDEKLTEIKAGVEEPVQLRPQQITIKDMRIGQVYNFTMQFKQVKDYPVDLYFLMDLSGSMVDDKQNLHILGEKLAETMRNITTHFRLGFGSFIDKKIKPFFVYKEPIHEYCKGMYSYSHVMNLNDNAKLFAEKVNSSKIIYCGDLPEGGFDALVQAMVCKERIGWRERARHIIVFATDNYSHLAGDGKLAGINEPNDGLCHLDENGSYTKALEQDYPSLGQVSRIAKDNGMNLIFAVTKQFHEGYKEFSKLIEGSSAGKLEGDSSNIVSLVRDQYKLITSSVEMRDSSDNGVKIRYYTSCLGQQIQENRKCDGLRVGSLVDFIVSIEILPMLTECPESGSDRKEIVISPVGLNELLIINLDLVCKCPCEQMGNQGFEFNSKQCSKGGNLECGICRCDEFHTGQNCECTFDKADSSSDCQAGTSRNSSLPENICSDRGSCVCGKCLCHQRSNPNEVVKGKNCECDNFSCNRKSGIICSGNGVCNCGKCDCFDDWTGNACDCRKNSQSCRPIGGDICSGNGECECGECKCYPKAKGRYCEDCPDCPSKCAEFENCINCKLFQSGTWKNSAKCDTECLYTIARDDNAVVKYMSERQCSYDDEDNCTISFVYGFDENGEKKVRVDTNKICPTIRPLPVKAIGFGLMGTLVAAGLILLLIWRVLTFVYDKKEYARFLRESKAAQWNSVNN